jgi:hypothetical protein
MGNIKDRIPLQIVEGRLVLASVIECKSLRVRKRFIDFIIDTGSPDSYMSDNDVRRLQIPIKNRSSAGEVDFGGSRFNQIYLPKFDMYLLKENKQRKDYLSLKVLLSALKTTKTSEHKTRIAQSLPSILGLDFLKEQKLSLHVILTEGLAYLQYEGE